LEEHKQPALENLKDLRHLTNPRPHLQDLQKVGLRGQEGEEEGDPGAEGGELLPPLQDHQFLI
jgi:hypothetical protein